MGIMRSSVVLIVATVYLFGSSNCCPLGQTITNITVLKTGEYKVTCSQRLFPVCSDYECYWTNLTCGLYAEDTNRPTHNQLLNNVTTRSSSTQDSNVIRRRCCHSLDTLVTNCRKVQWRPFPTADLNTFNVMEYGYKHLGCKNASIVRDVIIDDSTQILLTIEICCLIYAEGPVVCRKKPRPRHPYRVPPPVVVVPVVKKPPALAITTKQCVCPYKGNPGQSTACNAFPETNYKGLTAQCCCEVCSKSANDFCYWYPSSPTTCLICPKGESGYGNAPTPGSIEFVP